MKTRFLQLSAIVGFHAVFFAIALYLSSCTTRTETLPDGTVIKTEGVDKDALAAGSSLAQTLASRNSGK
jgi:hypothetical protein